MSAQEFRWGIISTGNIAECFAKDMLVDPKTRNVTDVVHKITAVGSRSTEKAQEFIDEVCGGDKSIKAAGSYEEVYADPNVDGIYIGTPHTYHYTNALDAMKAKKHVLCEKPITCNTAELQSLIETAKAEGVFLMEAVWTRFHPVSSKIKELLGDGSGPLGQPIVVHADLSGNFDINNIPKTHRILDPELGGGALLDLGPYPTVWAMMTLFEHPLNKNTFPTAITANMVKTPLTGVDRNTQYTLNFGDGDSFSAQAILSCSINLDASPIGATIRCENGIIRVHNPIFCPKSFSVETKNGTQEYDLSEQYVGGGWHWQADEVARCVREGKQQSDKWGWDKSLTEMKIFDEVRRIGGYALPEGVEKVKLM